VAEYLSSKGTLPPTNTAAGCSSAGSQYVASGGGWSAATGPIIYTSTGTGGTSECTLRLAGVTASGALTKWTGSFTGCPSKYVPSSFR